MLVLGRQHREDDLLPEAACHASEMDTWWREHRPKAPRLFAHELAGEGSLIFPDIALRHRRSPARRWLVELVGFWTREYIERKLRALRAAKLDNLILCIDAERNCAREELPEHARINRLRRRVDARQVLAVIEG